MSGIYVYHVPGGIDARAREYRERALAGAVRREDDESQSADTSRVAAAGVFHGRANNRGVVVSDDRRHLLALCGSVWFRHEDAVLASAQAVLSHLVHAKPTDGHSVLGHYSMVFCDDVAGTLMAECDPFGVYPLYYRELPDGVAVASEIKALAQCGAARVCIEALGEIVRFGYVVSDLTLVEGVRRLLPGARLCYENGRLRIERLRRSVFTRRDAPTPQVLQEMHAAFERNLARGLSCAQGKIFATLSGGMDSRIIALALKSLGVNFTAWSCGEEGSLERKVAGAFAQNAGIEFTASTVDAGRFADWCEQAIWVTEGRCPLGHAHFLDPLLNGDFPEGSLCAHGLIGDVVMGGDIEPKRWRGDEQLEAVCREHMKRIVYWPTAVAEATLAPPLLDAYFAAEDRAAASVFSRFSCAGDAYSNLLWFRYDFRLHGFVIPCLMSQILPWADPVVPYIDPRVFELCAAISRSAVLDRKLQIDFAHEHYPATFATPHVKDGVLLDWAKIDDDYDRDWRKLARLNRFRYLVTRLSRGRINLPARESYPAYEQWYRRKRSVRTFVDGVLLGDFSSQLGFWRRPGLERLLTDQRIGRNVWGAVGSLLGATVFARQFIGCEDRPDSVLR